MPTPPKDNSTQTNATSSNSSANAANASPAPSSSSGYPPPINSNYKLMARMPEGFHDGKRYAPTADGGPPNGGLVPGVYLYKDKLLVGVPEPPLATSTGGTQADRDAEGKGRSDGK